MLCFWHYYLEDIMPLQDIFFMEKKRPPVKLDELQVCCHLLCTQAKIKYVTILEFMAKCTYEIFAQNKKIAVGRIRTYAPRGNLISSQTP